jgi:hypothetical protein
MMQFIVAGIVSDPEPRFSTKDHDMTVAELTKNIQFTVDQGGQITAVVLEPSLWRRILVALEDSEDRALVQVLRARLAAGPIASKALRWQDVAADWQ